MPTVLLTGAASGIGAAVAARLHAQGWSIGAMDIQEEALQLLESSLGDRVAWRAVDVREAAALRAAVADLESALGPCDLLFASAGIGALTPGAALDVELVTRILRVNTEGVIHAMAAVLPGMLARGQGQIAAVSSVAGYRGVVHSGAYSASKAAVTAFCEAMRLELAPKGVAVTTIHPGFVATPMTANLPASQPFKISVEEAAEIIVARLPRRPAEINFPLPMATGMALLRLLPAAIFDPLAKLIFAMAQPTRR